MSPANENQPPQADLADDNVKSEAKAAPAEIATAPVSAAIEKLEAKAAPAQKAIPPASAAIDPVQQLMRYHSRRGLVRGGVAVAVGLLGWRWLRSRTMVDGIPWPLRTMQRFNQWVWSGVSAKDRLAPEFPAEAAGPMRVNGQHGWPDDTSAAKWKLLVSQPGLPDRTFVLKDLTPLKRIEMTTEFKCIEGWSQVATWSGYRLADFVRAHGLGRRAAGEWHPYVSLTTHDGDYYVGLDTPSALHPQTLLCDRLNGEPLAPGHGAPIRLIITIKYGIKNIKWLGRIGFQDERPADYWAERGYDWYSGL